MSAAISARARLAQFHPLLGTELLTPDEASAIRRGALGVAVLGGRSLQIVDGPGDVPRALSKGALVVASACWLTRPVTHALKSGRGRFVAVESERAE